MNINYVLIFCALCSEGIELNTASDLIKSRNDISHSGIILSKCQIKKQENTKAKKCVSKKSVLNLKLI